MPGKSSVWFLNHDGGIPRTSWSRMSPPPPAVQGGAEVCGSSERAVPGWGAQGSLLEPGMRRGTEGRERGGLSPRALVLGCICLAVPSAVCHGCPYSSPPPCGQAVSLGRTRLCCSSTARPPASRTGLGTQHAFNAAFSGRLALAS